MENEISKETQELFNNCNAIELLNKMADGIISQLAPSININIDLSSFENASKQHTFTKEGKFHFLTALELNYSSKNIFKILNNFIKEYRGYYHNDYVNEECFEKTMKQILLWFEDELMLNEFKENLFTIKCNDNRIKNEKFIFLLFEYCYKSPALNELYNFDKVDVRRQVLYRLEYTIYSILQQTKNFTKNISNELIEKLKFNYTLEECMEYIKFKEIELRRSFNNEFFFIIEHFLSTIRQYYKIRENEDIDKKDLIKEIFNHFDIETNIELEEIKSNINERCNETESKILDIFNGRNLKKDFIFYHDLFIQLRNSLHSNGKVSKNIQRFKLGKINFTSTGKNNFHNNMSIVHLIALSLIEVISIEKIIEKTISDSLIKDEYMVELDKLNKQESSQLSNEENILQCT